MQIFTVYSREDYCPFCEKAVALLEAKFEQFNVVKVPTDISREGLETMVRPHIGDAKLTVPQVFVEHGNEARTHIGGFDDLDVWFEQQRLNDDLDDMSL